MNDKTLIMYDLDGSIVGNPITGFYKVPNGIPYIEAVVPKDKYAIGVNVETKEPIFSDLPLSETELLSKKIDILKAENLRLKEVEKEQDKMIMDNAYKMTILEASMGGI